jgi:hypothetical protein
MGVYDKYYNKWFMTGDKKRWGPLGSGAEQKKFRITIHMVEDRVVDEYDLVCPHEGSIPNCLWK